MGYRLHDEPKGEHSISVSKEVDNSHYLRPTVGQVLQSIKGVKEGSKVSDRIGREKDHK